MVINSDNSVYAVRPVDLAKTAAGCGRKEEAVSPVVGVMLMLVVTIIIAAVVSAFGSGMMSDTKKPTDAIVSFQGVAHGLDKTTNGFTGLVFKVESGTLDISTLEFYTAGTDYGGGGECYMSFADGLSPRFIQGSSLSNPNQLKAYVTNPGSADLTVDWEELYDHRMVKFTSLDPSGEGMQPKETMLKTGDRFIMFAEYFNYATATSPATLGFANDKDSDGTTGAFISGAVFMSGDAKCVLSDKDGHVYWDDALVASDLL